MKYVLRKLGFYLIALWAALTLNFFLPRIMPGNPVDQLISKLSQKGQVTPATRHAVELMLGSDSSVPMWQQYLSYFGNIFRGDLGVSADLLPEFRVLRDWQHPAVDGRSGGHLHDSRLRVRHDSRHACRMEARFLD